MEIRRNERLTHIEVLRFFDRLFPGGVAGRDVLAEIAPAGWEQSPLLACCHPPVEQEFEEHVRAHRNLRLWLTERRPLDRKVVDALGPEPTLEYTRHCNRRRHVRAEHDVAELMGACLWEIFANYHLIVAADGRAVDLGSCREASTFLMQYAGDALSERTMDGLRFYFNAVVFPRRADLTPIDSVIFRRLKCLGADWVCRLPALARFGEETGIRPESAAVRAFRQVYGRDRSDWPRGRRGG